jgi:uncharacterized phage protein gp47/JayE
MTLPPELAIPTRAELVEQYLQFRRVANPLIDVSEGGEPWIQANVQADIQLQIIAQARRVTQGAFPSTAVGTDIEFWGDIEGVEASPATGSLGFVKISASVGGGEIQEGTFLTVKGQTNGPRFVSQVTSRYFDGEYVAISSWDTGRETNLPAGTRLQWENPPAGIGPLAIVVDQDGEGLSGGRDAASPAEHQAAILDKLANPPGAENDAHYRSEARKLGVPVQQAFTYPAILGAGTMGVTFAVYPTRRGGSRAPTGQQLRRVGAGLEYAFGADDSVLMTAWVDYPVTVAYKIDWQAGGGGWASAAPWPRFYEGSQGIVVKSATDALNFSVGAIAGSYSGITAPSAGKRIALFDKTTSTFVQKRILSVSGSGPWDITIDTTNRVSDENYVPFVGQRISPWSDSLQAVADSVLGVFDQLGPGELIAINPLDGNRRKRTPFAPANWPYRLTEDALEAAVSTSRVPQVFDHSVVLGAGATAPNGAPGVAAYVVALGDLVVHPKT